MKMKNVYILVVIVLFCLRTTIAQEQDNQFSLKPKVEVKNSSCELNTKELDVLSQYSKKSKLIIIISHLGEIENSAFGKRRLHNAKTFFTKGVNSSFTRSLESLLTAEGEKVSDKGYLDFYVEGELELRIVFGKNKDLSVSPCAFNFPDEKPCETDYEKLLYPCKSKK